MTLQTDIEAAQAKVDADNATLAADQAALDAAKAALAAVEPHLTLWQEVEATAAKWGGEAEAELKSIFERAKALLGV